MKHRMIALLLSLCCLTALFGCSVPEEYRYTNPTEYVAWEPTEAPVDKPEEPKPTVNCYKLLQNPYFSITQMLRI